MPIRQDAISIVVTAPLMEALERTVSPLRLGTYLTAGGFHPNLALALYLWNAAIGQSFHFPLQAVEIALRNVVNAALCAQFGKAWWLDQACKKVLADDRLEEIDKAVNRFKRKYGTQPDTDQLVAALTLGFWAAMLKRQYNRPLWDKQMGDAFPFLQNSEGMRDVSSEVNAIQEFRNRIFHHEPLIGRNLFDDYSRILKVAGWICPETREWIRSRASVPIVLRMRPRG